jgi:hypothetical protein
LGVRTETEKAGVFTNKKVQAVAGTTDKLFCEGKMPEFYVESRDPTGEFGLSGFSLRRGGGFALDFFLVLIIEFTDFVDVVQDQFRFGKAKGKAETIVFVGFQADDHIAFEFADGKHVVLRGDDGLRFRLQV